ncbi:aminoglycoside phosphotransferase family protein [Pseudoclavibacter sp. AY1F1]|uniref:phosphotransferase family protein n=1 Tax=Pseudoclavibacter sp. AY1F1 TaxID=2080583 RepID=UPI000CE9037D|nr:aminoglycoside phosphotransferase family protein [Pseudoclavibacter sp. AY1F1]PPF44106.1 aminoglycoside phosphotransferase family protein [Pseudoclavibacter sp. AY1F1]
MFDTAYAAQAAAAICAAASAALEAAGRESDPTSWTMVEHGSSNVVLLTSDSAVRVARSSRAAAESRRAQRLIDALPQLPFAVPRSLGPAVEVNGVTAIVQARIHGSPHDPGSGNPSAMAGLLEAIKTVPIAGIAPNLAAPRAFMGGDSWHERMHRDVIPLLLTSVRDEARRRVDALAQLDVVVPALTHGDLAGANVLWHDGRVSGVLDWDLATAHDTADDIASLASWHGWESVTAFASADELRRARIIAATHILQPLAFSLVEGRSAEEIRRGVQRANARLSS